MNRIILRIELGDWDGGNNGRYPKLLEWNLEDEDYPVDESEGWGHGLGGARSTLENFISSNRFQELNSGSSKWVCEIIESAAKQDLSVKEVGSLLAEEAKNHRVNIPDNLLNVLGRSVRYLNA